MEKLCISKEVLIFRNGNGICWNSCRSGWYSGEPPKKSRYLKTGLNRDIYLNFEALLVCFNFPPVYEEIFGDGSSLYGSFQKEQWNTSMDRRMRSCISIFEECTQIPPTHISPNWNKPFCCHIDASQLADGNADEAG